jgi:hypothetical protein
MLYPAELRARLFLRSKLFDEPRLPELAGRSYPENTLPNRIFDVSRLLFGI